jgi:hypothetical protein
MGEGRTHGTAALRQVAEGVRVSLQMQRGEPGTARLAVEDRDCHRLPAAHPPSAGEVRGAKGSVVPGPNQPGEIEVKENGQAAFTTTLPHTNLEPKARNSLLGKALVVYEARAIRAAHTSEEPVACAMVRRK